MKYSALDRRGRLLLASVFVFALTFSFTSCIGPHKINKWVARHYEDEPINPPRHKSEQIAFVSKVPKADGDAPSVTEPIRKHMLPLLFYWNYDYSWASTMNPQYSLNNFMATVGSYAASHGLKEKLNGNHIELNISQLPHAFTLEDKGWYVWIVLYGFGVETISLQPPMVDMVVSYRVLDSNNQEVKIGSITVHDPTERVNLKMFHSLKKTTYKYLTQYDANIAAMSKQFVDKLMIEL